MSYTVTKTENIVYSNVDNKSTYAILNSITFNVPLKRSKLNSFGLFFSTSGDVTATILVEVTLNTYKQVFNVASNQIVNGSPIIFPLDYFLCIDALLRISIKVSKTGTNGSINIRLSECSPCLYIESQKITIHTFDAPPVISIITPTYKTNIDLLKNTVNSVLCQSYQKWEWCIVDDGSGDSELSSYLESIKSDQVKVQINRDNKGIVSSTNDAIALASGDFVGFLDHDDLLDEDALLYIALEHQKDKNVDLIYTDEDKVLDDGSFVGPFYKPDWNYSLLLSSMYTCHFSVYRKSILDKISGMRSGFDGSQDYDLALRFIEVTQNIRHVPKILYHWRVTATSTSSSIVNKPDARINGARALADHLKRIKRNAKVVAGNFPGHYDVRYQIGAPPKVSIIIPFKDNISVLNNLLKTFELTYYPRYEILLMDNGSKELETKEGLSKLSRNKVIRIIPYQKVFNFSKINNYAVSMCAGSSELVLFLNNDIEIMHPEWLYNMVQHFVRPEVAAVGAKLLYLDHRIQHAGIYVGVNGIAGHSHKFLYDWNPGYFSRPHLTQDITAVTGACMMVRKDDFLKVDGFDPKLPAAFNDIDLCLKLRKEGKSIVYTPFARLYHRESYTRGYDTMQDENFIKAIDYITKKWDLSNFVDPFYNPNLPENCEGNSWI